MLLLRQSHSKEVFHFQVKTSYGVFLVVQEIIAKNIGQPLCDQLPVTNNGLDETG